MLNFGVTFMADPPVSEIVGRTVLAEQNGFDHVWLWDSHVLWQEVYPIFTLMAAGTTDIHIGPCVTNPVTRDPTVTAAALATLNEISGGRMEMGIGRGDSAQRVLGRKPVSVGTLEQACRTIRDLAEGREVDYDGTKVRIPWVRDGRLEVWMAAYGPKALKLCGEEADGFILQCADPHIARWTIGAVRAAAAAAGRDPAALTICVAAPAYVGDDYAHMRDQTRWFGGMVGNHVADLVARYGDTGDAVPRALTDYIKARKGYDYSHHGKADNPSTDFVPDDIVDRFCLLGPPERQVERLQELREIGADNFSVYLMHDNEDSTLDAYATEVIGRI